MPKKVTIKAHLTIEIIEEQVDTKMTGKEKVGFKTQQSASKRNTKK